MANPIDKINAIVINGVPIVWKEQNRGFTFFGIDSIIFWNNPSLVSILTPLRNELGSELYSLLIAYESSKGTYEDYHSMVTTLGQGFEEGFINWGKAVSGAGWGSFSILSLDWDKKEAILQIDDPWEMRIFKSEHPQDSAPFLIGKISGIFTHAFRTNCRSKIIDVKINENGIPHLRLKVCPSVETLEEELRNIQTRRSMSPQAGVKAINSALRRDQQRLLDIMDTIGVFVWETDVEMIVSYVTNTSVPILGLPPEKLLGKCFLDLIHEDDVGSFQEALSLLKTKPDQHKFVEMKVRIWTEPGRLMWLGCNIKALYDFSGNHWGYLGAGQDITNQIQLETQLKEQQQKSIQGARMAALGEMAGGIGHELNNPLAVIAANAWQLQNSIQENSLDLEHFKKTLGAIQDTTHRMAKIIKGMRSFSRDGESDPFFESSLKAIIEETLLYCREKFANHGIELKVLEPSQDLKIECKPTQISQILLNFLNNSFDAVYSLNNRWIELLIQEEIESVKIQITDSGPGIPKSLRGKLMQPFFTTKEPGKGTGLGLSISHGIAIKHHGKIYIDEDCKNTRFVLELPKRQPRNGT